MQSIEARVEDRKHLRCSIQFHGARAERNHGGVEGKISVFKQMHVSNKFHLRTIAMEHGVSQKLTLSRQGLGELCTTTGCHRIEINGAGSGTKHLQDGEDVLSLRGLVEGNSDRTVAVVSKVALLGDAAVSQLLLWNTDRRHLHGIKSNGIDDVMAEVC